MKTYATFMYLREWWSLRLYIEETQHVVDKWVICEADRTFTDLAKPFHFDERARFFLPWLDRIIRVRCTDSTLGFTPEARDRFYRDCCLRGLHNVLKPEDRVIVGDCDEIPATSAIAVYKNADGIRALKMLNHYWYLNCRAIDLPWTRTVIVSGDDILRGWTPVKLRYKDFPLIENGGWHFSGMGGANELDYKLRSFAHAGMAHHRDEVAGIRDGTWVKREHCTPVRVVPIDETYPAFVRENQGLMKEWGMIYEDIPQESVHAAV